MNEIKIDKKFLHLPIWSEDENLIPAKVFLNQWYAGASYFTFRSSGSTGNPKEIILSRQFITESAQRTINLFHISSSDNLLLALNTSFMGGLMMVARALIANCSLAYIPPQSVTKESLKKLPNIKLASFVPAQISPLLDNEHIDIFSQLNIILLGGAPIDTQLQHAIGSFNSSCIFYHTYGMTETASHVALKNISQSESSYTALENYTFSVDPNDRLIIDYKGKTNFQIQTNDIVKLITPTTFEWIGRSDWIINTGGIKFNMETAENCVRDFFNKQQIKTLFTSYKTNDSKYGERWVLIIENDPFDKKTETELCEYSKNKLGKYVYPREIKYTQKIIYLSSGKIDRLKTYTNSY